MNMNEKYAFLYKIKSDNTICLYRVYANTSHIKIPNKIDSYEVTEISNYCFSIDKNKQTDLIASDEQKNLYEIAQDQVESIYFPDSLKKIGSFVFYNCKKLTSISFGENIEAIGSDICLNCHQLQSISFRTTIERPTVLKQILTQISWDIDIHFTNHSLFYSEYYEMYDEIGPAHIFGLNISGEGFRLRQCFKNGIVDLAEYIKTFPKLCVEESPKTISHFIMYQYMKNPCFFQDWLYEHIDFFSNFIIKTNLLGNQKKLCILTQAIQDHLIQKECLSDLIAYTSNANQIEMTTHLIDLKKQYFSSKTYYDFEDF